MSDRALMAHLVQGDPFALESLYNRHARVLYSLALRITGDSQAAEEVLQDTFFQLWRKSFLFDSDRGSLIGWLLTITRHRAISRMRLQRGRARPESLPDHETLFPEHIGSTVLEEHIVRELVSAALAGLPEVQREAIMLAYFEGWTCDEIAIRTDTPPGTVKSRLRSALKTMKGVLSNPNLPIESAPQSCSATLAKVLITEQLANRLCRKRYARQEIDSLRVLAEAATTSSAQLIDSFLKMAIELCHAGTAGLSFLETDSRGECQFRWTNLAGKLAKHVGGTTPRNFSPCGVTLDRGSPQLFAYPARYFDYFNAVPVPIVEGLVIPFHVGKETEGRVWIVSHQEKRDSIPKTFES